MNHLQKETHFAEGASWAEDRGRRHARSQRRAWVFAWMAAAIAVTEAFALIALAPLKTVVPHTILVDRQTGFVTTLDPSKPAKLSPDEALTRSLLVQYVTAREGFSIGSVRSDYRQVLSWSSGGARAGYVKDMAASDPNSPLSRYPRSTILEVTPKSVSELGNGSAMVRFDVARVDGEGRAWAPTPYAAVVQYRFVPRQMSVEERFLNPLGFEVTRYQKDPEALPAALNAGPSGVPEPAIEQGPGE